MSSSPSKDSDGDPPLVDGKWGYVVYTEHYAGPEDGTVTIDRADPHALVLDEILHEALEGSSLRASVLRLRRAPTFCTTPRDECGYPSHPLCFTGWFMDIDLPGRPLVYRIGRFRPAENTWEASWPD